MKRNRTKTLPKALLAIVLALTVSITFMPFMGDPAQAADKQGDEPEELMLVNDDGTETRIDPSDITPSSDAALTKAVGKTGAVNASASPYTGSAMTDAADCGETATDTGIKTSSAVLSPVSADLDTEELYSNTRIGKSKHTAAVPSGTAGYDKKTLKSKGIAAFNGKLTGAHFLGIYVDGSLAKDLGNSTSIRTSIDMKNYDVGYHDIIILTDAVSNGQVMGFTFTKVPTYIYSKPANGKKLYEVYWNFFRYQNNNLYSRDSSCDLYMEYKKKGTKKWKKCGPMKYGNQYTRKKLKSSKKYLARTYYGKTVTYNGKDYFFSGKTTGKVSKALTFRTGKAKKVPVKSLKVKIYKIKKSKIRHYGAYTGVYLYTETIYTYKMKVVLKLKKKPGAKGIYMNSKRLKGNKKTYTIKLGSYMSNSKPKKPKLTYYIYSYQDPSYGGYSKLQKKKTK